MLNKYNSKVSDQYTTPIKVWKNIEEFIPKDKKIWCPFYCNGMHTLKDLSYDIIHKDEDFFKYAPDEYDLICDNPPFSILKKIIPRLYELDKPFILIVRINTICNKYCNILKENYGDLQMIIPNGRISFNAKNPSFDSAYLCYKMNLDKDIIFLK